MKYLYIAACTLLLAACNDNKSKAPATEQSAPQENKAPAPLPVEENVPQAFFAASGKDWTLDVKSSMNGTFPMIFVQNGQDTIKTVLNRSMNGNEKPVPGKSNSSYIGVVEGAERGEVFELNVFPGQCTNADGSKSNFSCKISIGKKNLTGCGNYSED
jgi:uncharacterized membrane protein